LQSAFSLKEEPLEASDNLPDLDSIARITTDRGTRRHGDGEIVLLKGRYLEAALEQLREIVGDLGEKK